MVARRTYESGRVPRAWGCVTMWAQKEVTPCAAESSTRPLSACRLCRLCLRRKPRALSHCLRTPPAASLETASGGLCQPPGPTNWCPWAIQDLPARVKPRRGLWHRCWTWKTWTWSANCSLGCQGQGRLHRLRLHQVSPQTQPVPPVRARPSSFASGAAVRLSQWAMPTAFWCGAAASANPASMLDVPLRRTARRRAQWTH